MSDQGELEVLLAAVTAGTLLAGFLSSRLHQRADRIITRITDVSAMLQQRADENRPISRPELRDAVTPLVSPLGRDRITAYTTGGIFIMFLVCVAVCIYTLVSAESQPTLATVIITLIFLVVVGVSVLDSGAIAYLISKQENRVLVRYLAIADVGLDAESEGWVLPLLRRLYCAKAGKERIDHERVPKLPDLDNADTWRLVEKICRDAFRAQPALLSACVGAVVASEIASIAEHPELPYVSPEDQSDLMDLCASLADYFKTDPPAGLGNRRVWLTASYALALDRVLERDDLGLYERQLTTQSWAERLLKVDAGDNPNFAFRDPITNMIVLSRTCSVQFRMRNTFEPFDNAMRQLSVLRSRGRFRDATPAPSDTAPARVAKVVAFFADDEGSDWCGTAIPSSETDEALGWHECPDIDKSANWCGLVKGTRHEDDDAERLAGYPIDALVLLIHLRQCAFNLRDLTEPACKEAADLRQVPEVSPLFPDGDALSRVQPRDVAMLMRAASSVRPGWEDTQEDPRRVLRGELPLGQWARWFQAGDLPATWLYCAQTRGLKNQRWVRP